MVDGAANNDPRIVIDIRDSDVVDGSQGEIENWFEFWRKKTIDSFHEFKTIPSVALFLYPHPENNSEILEGFIDLRDHMKDIVLDERLAPVLRKMGAFALINIHSAWSLSAEDEKLDIDAIYAKYGSVKHHPGSVRIAMFLETTCFMTRCRSFQILKDDELKELEPDYPSDGRLVGWLKPRIVKS